MLTETAKSVNLKIKMNWKKCLPNTKKNEEKMLNNKSGEMLIFLVSKEIPNVAPNTPRPRPRSQDWPMWCEQIDICRSHPILLSPAFTSREMEWAAVASLWSWGKGQEDCRNVASGFWKMAGATCLWASYNVTQIPTLCQLHLGRYCYFTQQHYWVSATFPALFQALGIQSEQRRKAHPCRASFTPRESRAGNTNGLFLSHNNDKGSL